VPTLFVTGTDTGVGKTFVAPARSRMRGAREAGRVGVAASRRRPGVERRARRRATPRRARPRSRRRWTRSAPIACARRSRPAVARGSRRASPIDVERIVASIARRSATVDVLHRRGARGAASSRSRARRRSSTLPSGALGSGPDRRRQSARTVNTSALTARVAARGGSGRPGLRPVAAGGDDGPLGGEQRGDDREPLTAVAVPGKRCSRTLARVPTDAVGPAHAAVLDVSRGSARRVVTPRPDLRAWSSRSPSARGYVRESSASPTIVTPTAHGAFDPAPTRAG
jgi:hypothetical protein